MRKLIVFELNGVPFNIIDRFAATHPSSTFACMLTNSAQFVGRTPDTIHLHPRISWTTFHRGVPDHVHGRLEPDNDTTGNDRGYPCYWELLRQAGHTIGVGASIGSAVLPEQLDRVRFYLPDPLAATDDAHPRELCALQALITETLGRCDAAAPRLAVGRTLVLLASASRLGLTIGSLRRLAAQLLRQRIHSKQIARPSALRAALTFDAVFHQIERTRPDLATVFTNRVAPAMDRYWAAAFPEDYGRQTADCAQTPTESTSKSAPPENHMPGAWIEAHAREIDLAMLAADHQLERLKALADRRPETRLLLISSLGRAAAPAIPMANRLICADLTLFMSRFGHGPSDWQALPDPESSIHVRFRSPTDAESFMKRLEHLRVAGGAAVAKQTGSHTVSFSIKELDAPEEGSLVSFEGTNHPVAAFGLQRESLQDASSRTACHTAEGATLIYDPLRDLSDHQRRETIDTTAFTAAILKSFRVPVPDYMPEVPDSLARCLN